MIKEMPTLVYDYVFELIASGGGSRCPMSIFIDVGENGFDELDPPPHVIEAIQFKVDRLCRCIEEAYELPHGMIKFDWSLPLELASSHPLLSKPDVVV